MVEPVSDSPERLASSILEFCRSRLGPASEGLFGDSARQALALAHIRRGCALEDAVLREVHREAKAHAELADEFLGFFLADLTRAGHRIRSSALRRFLDTGDLVQSVIGDLWPDLFMLRFETRGQFLAFLVRRLGWKASDSYRYHERRPALELAPERSLQENDPASSGVASHGEERERLALAILKLGERDREVLGLYLQGASNKDLAQALGLSPQAARMARNRAIERARRLA